MLAGTTTDLVVYLVIEILRKARISSMLNGIASGGNELLQLDSRDEVLVLRGHQSIVPGKQKYLVVSLGSLSLVQEKCCATLL